MYAYWGPLLHVCRIGTVYRNVPTLYITVLCTVQNRLSVQATHVLAVPYLLFIEAVPTINCTPETVPIKSTVVITRTVDTTFK